MLASVLHTVIIYAVVIFAMRLMGKRQLGELQPSELVTTFMISNVASICIDEPDLPLLSSLVPILLIAALEILNSTAAYYLPGYAALLFGRPVTVIQDGQIRQDALRHLRMTPGDLMEALRGKDIFDPRKVSYAVIETNGSISAENWEKYKPLTPDNVKISVDDKGLHTAIVIDGKPVEEYFKNKNIKQSEIELLLKTNGKQANKLLLMTVDDNGNVYTVRKASTK